ncbi:hypothetical protein CDEST_11959 [Colletotrichum destructivum]|uniref:Uncharacterized protein n=1 Tax=Colletotrichum destructivum TaxID=34406 RepID=A0AAX4IUQ6_9PEZI|nr:hypothetical protein CDEST_11959 [Colletotrichum destructivum]
MSAQATENTAHPTPPHTEPHSETSETEVPKQRRQETQESGRQPAKPKTGTEEKIEKETPSLSADSAAPEVDGAQQDTGNHVARRPKRHNVARRGKDHASGQTYQPQDGQQVAPQNQQVQSKGKGAPSVRLDMNLDVDIDLKAKIKGDIELSILGGKQGRR